MMVSQSGGGDVLAVDDEEDVAAATAAVTDTSKSNRNSPSSKASTTTRLLHTKSLTVGIASLCSNDAGLVEKGGGSSTCYEEEIAHLIRRIAPDRFHVIHLTASPSSKSSWPLVHILVIRNHAPTLTSTISNPMIDDYITQNNPILLSDWSIRQMTHDRRIFYNVLDAYANTNVSTRLPLRVYVNRNHVATSATSQQQPQSLDSNKIINHGEHVEINGRILLKPLLERPAIVGSSNNVNPSSCNSSSSSSNSNSMDFRIYYPMSSGGGCKFINGMSLEINTSNNDNNNNRVVGNTNTVEKATTRAIYRPDRNAIRATTDFQTSYIYEELVDTMESNRRVIRHHDGQIPSYYTHCCCKQRDQLKNVAKPFLLPPFIPTTRDGRFTGATSNNYNVDDKDDNDANRVEDTLPQYEDDFEITHESDLSRIDRKFYIVTTAALPWMTGTAVNPLLRAAYLCRGRPSHSVTLVIPWLEKDKDRIKVYGTNHGFLSSSQQEEYIRTWLRDRAQMPKEADPTSGLQILWYPAMYHDSFHSIFAMGDTCKLIPNTTNADVCVLEEPEHLNWFRASGDPWTTKFNFVIGIVHTNYKAYASSQYGGIITAPIVSGMSTLMVRAYCHKVIKLSGVLQAFAAEKEVVANVHGVRSEFLAEGKRRASKLFKINDEGEISEKKSNDNNSNDAGSSDQVKPDAVQDGDSRMNLTSVYFIGKVLWAKGLDKMMYLQEFYKECTGDYFDIDIYGDGPELKEIKRAYHGRSTGSKRKAAAKFIQSLYLTTEEQEELEVDSDDEEEEETVNILRASLKAALSDAPAIEVEQEEGEDGVDEPISEVRGHRYAYEVRKQLSNALKTTMEFELPKSLHEYRMNPIPAKFLGRSDHAQLTDQYKVFVNPSITEVLCTTTAEALAMGKFAIIPTHPSNAFFAQFPNCLMYQSKLEFAANFQWALSNEPEPLTEEMSYQFTWEAATERFIQASSITMRESRKRALARKSKMDDRIAMFHNKLTKGRRGDVLRSLLGGGPVSGQNQYEKRNQQASSLLSSGNAAVDEILMDTDDYNKSGIGMLTRSFWRSDLPRSRKKHRPRRLLWIIIMLTVLCLGMLMAIPVVRNFVTNSSAVRSLTGKASQNGEL